MSADTAKLIAQARGLVTTVRITPPTDAQINSAFMQYESIALALAAALEAAEAWANEEHDRLNRWLFEDEHWQTRAEAAEAQRDALAAGLRVIASGEYASQAEDFAAGVLAAIEVGE